MQKKKIIYLVTKDDIGGAQKYVNDLSLNLDKNQFAASILTGGKGGMRFLSNTFKPHLFFINDWLALFQLFFKFRKEKPDIVHLNSSKAGVIGAIASKMAGVPKVIFTAHGWVFNPDNSLGFLKRKFYVWLHKLAALFQDKIINVSEYDRKLAVTENISASNKLIAIHNGIDYKNTRFLDKQTARKAISKLVVNYKLPITGNEVWVGSVGRLVNEKKFSDFVKAAALVKNPAVKFFIIGSGEERERLKLLIAGNQLENRFFILENIAPAAPYLKAFDLFILSSIKEGLPYTLIEAMAAELPIVATRVGGIPEILSPDGVPKFGLTMPPNEPEELARAIKHFIDNPATGLKMAREGRAFIQERMSLEEMVSKTAGLYL